MATKRKVRCDHCGEDGHRKEQCELWKGSQRELQQGIRDRYQRGVDECQKAVRAWALEFRVTERVAREQIREAL